MTQLATVHRREALDLGERYAEALLSPDSHPSHARRLIDQALAAGMSPLTVYVDVMPEALYEVGRRWERGEITVAQEHIATAAAQVVLRDLMARLPSNEKNGQTAIVAAVEGELHELGGRVVADLLDADGWEVFYVGAATPTDALLWLAEDRRPDLVALSATLSTQLPTLADAVARVRAIRYPPRFVFVGGQAAVGMSDAATKLGADFYASRADQAMDHLRRAAADNNRSAATESLTQRERDVLSLLGEGLTNFEIAQRLTISVPTIKTHVEHILRKLQLRNRAEAAAFVSRRPPTTAR